MKPTIETEWKLRGYSCDIWMDPAGQRWENYVHDTDELFMVIDGKIELEINGKKTKPKPGEEILIPAHTKHSVRNLGKTESRWYYGYKIAEADRR